MWQLFYFAYRVFKLIIMFAASVFVHMVLILLVVLDVIVIFSLLFCLYNIITEAVEELEAQSSNNNRQPVRRRRN